MSTWKAGFLIFKPESDYRATHFNKESTSYKHRYTNAILLIVLRMYVWKVSYNKVK